jgi:hypothetical protein
MAWKIFCGALLPVRLCDLPKLLPKLLEHLTKYRRKTRPTALEKFRSMLLETDG